MTQPILTVTALYDFTAIDESGLSFKAGDVIQVHDQLISGWWDGVCNGARGWFPSNYVAVPEQQVLQTPNAEEATTWIRNMTQDGQIYYTNRFTGESTLGQTTPNSASVDSLNSSTLQGSPRPSGDSFTESRNPSMEGTAVRMGSTETNSMPAFSQSSNGRPNSAIQVAKQIALSEGLPPNWGRRQLDDGRVYYYNMITNETVWNINEVNTETGELLNRQNRTQSPANTNANANGQQTNSVDAGNLTWARLLSDITVAIQDLDTSARHSHKEKFIPQSLAIVESIRVMLAASGTAKRDAPLVESHRQLKSHHRNIMATLSRLVLSAKLASSVWPPPDTVSRMQTSGAEVLAAVQGFVVAAQEAGVEINAANIPQTPTTPIAQSPQQRVPNVQENAMAAPQPQQQQPQPAQGGLTSPAQQGGLDSAGSQETISLLENYTFNVVQMISTLLETIRTNQWESGRLITDVRTIVMEVGNFLAIADDLPLDSLPEPSTADFKYNRLALYNSISGLVMATSTATQPFPPSDALQQVVMSTGLVEKAIRDLLISTKFLIDEKETHETQSLQSYIIHSVGPAGFQGVMPTGYGGAVPMSPIAGYAPPLSAGPQMGPMGGGFGNVQQMQSMYAQNPNMIMSPGSSISAITPIDYQSMGRSGSVSGPSQFVPAPEHRPSVDLDYEEQLASLVRGSTKSKAQKLLGNDAPVGVSSTGPASADSGAVNAQSSSSGTTSGMVPNSPASNKPWYLAYDYKPEEIIINPDGKVRGAKLHALVERLTLHDSTDTTYMQAFLLTYRSFTTTTEFFDLLKKRFLLPPPEGLTEPELNEWTKLKRVPIRIRVGNVWKSWVETFCQDDEEDKKGMQELKAFATTTMYEEMAAIAAQIQKLIERRENGLMKKIVVTTMGKDVPPPILPRGSLKRIRFLDLDPLEVARQLTIIEARDYNKIQAVEFLKKAWSDKESNIALNVKAMIGMSNQVSGWVGKSILSEKEVKKRASLIKHFISIAEKCRSLNNFNTLMAILAGLNTAPIHRLKKTWEALPKKTQEVLDGLREMMEPTKNFSKYREILHTLNPPCVPFLGFYLTDLTFIEDGSPNMLKNAPPDMINFAKRMKTAEVIREVQQYQNVPYLFTPVPELQQFLTAGFSDTLDEAALYEMSLQLEPRERIVSEDEKIARLLTESGFL